MKSLFCLLCIVYCLLAFISCKPRTDFSKEISSLDSAKAVLTATREKLSSVRSPDSNATGFLSASIKEIRSLQASDTVNKETAVLLAELSGLKGILIGLKRYRENYIRAAEESLKRAGALQHDLIENLIEDDNKSREYIVHEAKALEKIIAGLKLIIEMNAVSVHKLDSLKTRITLISDSLKVK